MTNQEIANFIREKYSRLDYLLLTLVSCALVFENHIDENSHPALQMVAETFKGLRDDLTEDETATVGVLMAEINHLQSIDSPDES